MKQAYGKKKNLKISGLIKKIGWNILYLFITLISSFFTIILKMFEVLGKGLYLISFLVPFLVIAYVAYKFINNNNSSAMLLIAVTSLFVPIVIKKIVSGIIHILSKYVKWILEKKNNINTYRKFPFLHMSKRKQRKITYEQLRQENEAIKRQKEFDDYCRANNYGNVNNNTSNKNETTAPTKSTNTSLFAGCNNLESLKKRRRELMKIYHPDNQNGDNKMLITITEEYKQAEKSFT